MKGQPTFSIGHLKIVDHLILGVAHHLLEEGTLPDLPRLETHGFNSWTQISDNLTRGEVNGAFITIPEALTLFGNGLDIRLLMFTHRGGSMILKKKSSAIKQIKDFAGRSVLIPSHLSVQHMLLHRMVTSAGLQPGNPSDPSADLFVEPISPYLMPRMIAQDIDGDIAGFAVAEPYGTRALVDNTATRICLTGSLWPDHPCCAFVLHNNMVRQYPETVMQLISFFIQAAQQLHTDLKDCLMSVGQVFLDQPLPVIEKLISDTDICFDPARLSPDVEQIALIQDYMTDTMGIIRRKIDIERFIDASFINAEGRNTTLEN
jgi:NitT/TauT family transport system substrate-binding protein